MSDRPTYPNFAGKHEHDAFFSPQDFINYLRRSGVADFIAPESVIFTYQSSLVRHVQQHEELDVIWKRARATLHSLRRTNGRVGFIGDFGIGAPIATTTMEELIALGTKRFVSIGTAGALQRDCRIGDVLVCDRAIRDEGCSHHYLAPGKYSFPSATLTARLKDALDARGVRYVEGTTWTIDTPYRETVAEARHYQDEGVLCVEMEAAALFAVATYRGVETASAFVVSDSLAELEWEPQFLSAETANALVTLYEAAVDSVA